MKKKYLEVPDYDKFEGYGESEQTVFAFRQPV